MITETNTAGDTNTAVQNPLGLKKIHHVEFYVVNAKQAEFFVEGRYYRNLMTQIAISSLEIRN